MHINTGKGSADVADVWASFLKGDEEAYSCIIRKFARPLFNYGIRFSSDRDLIKDCIQDVFFDLWNKRDRISETSYVQAYLFKSIRHRIIREKSKWEQMESLENVPFLGEFNIETKIIEEQSNREINDRIARVFNSLPQRQKEIVYLRFYENLGHDKICTIMGLTRQSVYNLLQKALHKMRKEWVTVALYSFFYLYR
ncbi:RNA polymerase sigma factor [Arcticibacter tournemirensis]|uniref:Sigma-70 family RNA polymerase sigma factor n=1 Tax=Arcticibacter tournemirensis TaxID=699437 RepID=A0A4V1KHW7_9SPHI|nr:sigma-70 family RNA polymerase sigma factor [Arcticibacter tournemirensis]RXF68632.1 sigma-70 family RNA polymerase sigma factor [Arcticibacter tournemirensis]